MNTDEIKHLIQKYNSQIATPEEKMVIEQWYERVNGADMEQAQFDSEETKKRIFDGVASTIARKTVVTKPKQVKLFSSLFFKAAVILIVVLGGAYFYLKQPIPVTLSSSHQKKATKIIPGGNNAVLLLADGSQIILNKSVDGQIANQSGVKIIKTKSGELIYRFVGHANINTTAINTVSTPRGGQYHLILTDGTEAWLNASSSIKFPTAFTGTERKVEVKGEVYFEVAKNKSKPFIVHTDQSDIKVLGTHFNINTYNDEDYQRTTLLEGSIELTRGSQKRLLVPGEQASTNGKTDAIKIKEIEDLNAIVAWKNGYFQFERADLQSVMRQVARWYDAEVDYTGPIPTKQYTGIIPRSVNVAKLVEMLAYSGIHCKVEHNRITVDPK